MLLQQGKELRHVAIVLAGSVLEGEATRGVGEVREGFRGHGGPAELEPGVFAGWEETPQGLGLEVSRSARDGPGGVVDPPVEHGGIRGERNLVPGGRRADRPGVLDRFRRHASVASVHATRGDAGKQREHDRRDAMDDARNGHRLQPVLPFDTHIFGA